MLIVLYYKIAMHQTSQEKTAICEFVHSIQFGSKLSARFVPVRKKPIFVTSKLEGLIHALKIKLTILFEQLTHWGVNIIQNKMFLRKG